MTTDPHQAAVALVRRIFDSTASVLRSADLEGPARILERCSPDPGTPHTCAYGTLRKLQTAVRMAWGQTYSAKGTPLAAAVEAVAIAETAFFTLAVAAPDRIPLRWMEQQQHRLEVIAFRPQKMSTEEGVGFLPEFEDDSHITTGETECEDIER